MTWLRFLFSFEGRISRRDYWLRCWLPLLLLMLIAVALLPPDAFVRMVPLEEAQAHPYAMMTPLAYVIMIAVNFVAIAVSVKRCHDRDRSGWFLLVYFIPVIGELWVLIELGFLPGTAGPNRFGRTRGSSIALRRGRALSKSGRIQRGWGHDLQAASCASASAASRARRSIPWRSTRPSPRANSRQASPLEPPLHCVFAH